MKLPPLGRREGGTGTSTSLDRVSSNASRNETAATATDMIKLAQLPDGIGMSGLFSARAMYWAPLQRIAAFHM